MKSVDGKMKVFFYIGEKMGIIGLIVGVCLIVLLGILIYKKCKV